ncbi:MAG: SPASM domain-containing protein [Lachnospiraceae bacterium]|nr:SPASM domain-containing protein [Lachnospiraceae bacterium]
MSTLDKQIEEEKQRYLEFANLNKGKHIYIYGAGKQAIPIADFFMENNIDLEGFCVTDKSSNKKFVNQLPVYQIDEIPYNEAAFVFGVRVQLNDEIEEILRGKGYTNFLPASDLIRYIGAYGYSFYTSPMIEITTKLGCAVNCKYCPQELFIKEYLKIGNPEKVLSFENFKICIDKLPENTFIEFAGFTEPFFNAQCVDMIKYAKRKGHRVNLFTTLRGLEEKQLEELLKIEFEEFVLHVPDKEGYAVIPMDAKYIEMVRRLSEAKKPNGNSFIDYACAQGTVADEIAELLGNDVRIYVVLNDRAGNLQDACLYGRRGIRGRLRCELSRDINHNVLLPDGRVILCSNDWGMKHVMGNLIYETYEQILNGIEACRIREAMNSEDDDFVLCRNCFQAICEGDL